MSASAAFPTELFASVTMPVVRLMSSASVQALPSGETLK
jgi:hypothetical protein